MKPLLLLAFGMLCLATPVPGQFPESRESTPSLATIDSIMVKALADHELPGAVIEIGHRGRVFWRKAYGERALEPDREPMTPETIFDIASLTKPLVTATAIMQLFEQGRLRLDDPVVAYVPALAGQGRDAITIRNLLTHYSGLPADLDLSEPWHGKAEGFRRADAAQPVTPPGVVFRYSDINFVLLQQVVETITGTPLDRYAEDHILAPLGLMHTRFLPPASWRGVIAPTEYDETHTMLRGTVHDPTARRMDGVAGDAGLFSTADDVAVYAQALLDRLAGRASRFPLSRLTLTKMTRPAQPPTGTAIRGLGWDIDSPFSANRGELFPLGSFGHTGFTGTSLWIDPYSDSYVIILANAVHPRAGHSLASLRGRLANAAAEALVADPSADPSLRLPQLTGYNEAASGERLLQRRNGHVLCGIDVLEKSNFGPLAELVRAHGGQLRAGLLTNQTGVDLQGRSTINVLQTDAARAAPGFRLTTLFSPEHGIEGRLDREGIAGRDATSTQLPVISLYGADASSRRPSEEQLRGLDAVIIDLQDAGVRFYTYETLIGYFLEAAAKTGIEIIVLDRPDPITGAIVQGPVSEAGRESYTDYMPLPVRHGMTLGELARYFQGERHLAAKLTVIAMEGWQRGDWLDATGASWVNPSPNLRNLTAMTLYPGVALVEATNVSVGRGTESPFEKLGAPWIDGRALAARLNERMLPGVRFLPVSFTPDKPYPYAGVLCHGVNLLVTDRNVLDAPELGLELIAALSSLYPKSFDRAAADRLLVNKASADAVLSGKDAQTVAAGWIPELDSFKALRQAYLLYPEPLKKRY